MLPVERKQMEQWVSRLLSKSQTVFRTHFNWNDRIVINPMYQYLGVLFLFFSYSFLFLFASLDKPYSSDPASILLQAKSIVDGNILLKGWSLSTASFYTTDLVAMVLGVLLFGPFEKVSYIVTAVTHGLMAVSLIWVISVNDDGSISWRRLIASIAMALLLIVNIRWGRLTTDNHTAGLIYCVWSILILRKINHRFQNIFVFIWFFLMFLAFTGDALTLYSWGIAAMIMFGYRTFTGENRLTHFKLLIATLLAVAASKAFEYLIKVNGGFRVMHATYGIVRYEDIGKNLNLWFMALFDMYSIEIFGQPIFSRNTLVGIIHLIFLCLFIVILYKGLKNFRLLTLIEQILIVGILMNLAEYLLGNVSVNRSTMRYIVPTLVLSIIFVGIRLDREKVINSVRSYLPVFFIIFGLSLIPPLYFSRTAVQIDGLSRFLEAHQLEHGYANYWAASIVTTHTNGRVSVAPIILKDGYLAPFRWESDKSWYERAGNFVVVDRSTEIFDVTVETATSTFGPSQYEYEVDPNYTILVWDKDITQELGK